MSKFDFSKYLVAQELIESVGLTNEAERITFLQMDREEAAVELATLSLLIEGTISNDISMRRAVNEESDKAYNRIGSRIHAFAKSEARSACGLSDEDVVRLYKNIELGGSRYM
ncbi:hypothetical protein P9597_11155 [Aneurinibacillus migulanus]|uniref:hypothetical protein n=1 Tax=Aneurinibacillus migulanus TaxID=47500 RepID=UPI002E1AF11D|nr:hypothetical protein [Aneurinibacillus migulanus]